MLNENIKNFLIFQIMFIKTIKKKYEKFNKVLCERKLKITVNFFNIKF